MAEGKPIPVRFSIEFIARLDQVAAAVGVTRSALIRMLVEKWVEHFEQHGTASLPPEWNGSGRCTAGTRGRMTNPLFPALRTGPTAVSGASRRKQISSSQ